MSTFLVLLCCLVYITVCNASYAMAALPLRAESRFGAVDTSTRQQVEADADVDYEAPHLEKRFEVPKGSKVVKEFLKEYPKPQSATDLRANDAGELDWLNNRTLVELAGTPFIYKIIGKHGTKIRHGKHIGNLTCDNTMYIKCGIDKQIYQQEKGPHGNAFLAKKKAATILELNYRRHDLHGTLPTSLIRFSHLIKLDLGNNEIRGSIPDHIGVLGGTLKYLDLSKNNLTGTIPTTLGLLTNLEFLDLSQNQLVGRIPASLALLTRLTQLRLDHNNLGGTIPTELANVLQKNLQDFYFGANNLRGYVPSEFLHSHSKTVCRVGGYSASATNCFFCYGGVNKTKLDVKLGEKCMFKCRDKCSHATAFKVRPLLKTDAPLHIDQLAEHQQQDDDSEQSPASYPMQAPTPYPTPSLRANQPDPWDANHHPDVQDALIHAAAHGVDVQPNTALSRLVEKARLKAELNKHLHPSGPLLARPRPPPQLRQPPTLANVAHTQPLPRSREDDGTVQSGVLIK